MEWLDGFSFFVLSLWESVYILYLQYILIEILNFYINYLNCFIKFTIIKVDTHTQVNLKIFQNWINYQFLSLSFD